MRALALPGPSADSRAAVLCQQQVEPGESPGADAPRLRGPSSSGRPQGADPAFPWERRELRAGERPCPGSSGTPCPVTSARVSLGLFRCMW